MGCLYSSPAGTAVLQLTSPPGVPGKVSQGGRDDTGWKLEHEGLISGHKGTVFVFRVPRNADTEQSIGKLRRWMQIDKQGVSQREDVLACVDLLDAKPNWLARLVVRFDNAKWAEAAAKWLAKQTGHGQAGWGAQRDVAADAQRQRDAVRAHKAAAQTASQSPSILAENSIFPFSTSRLISTRVTDFGRNEGIEETGATCIELPRTRRTSGPSSL